MYQYKKSGRIYISSFTKFPYYVFNKNPKMSGYEFMSKLEKILQNYEVNDDNIIQNFGCNS